MKDVPNATEVNSILGITRYTYPEDVEKGDDGAWVYYDDHAEIIDKIKTIINSSSYGVIDEGMKLAILEAIK